MGRACASWVVREERRERGPDGPKEGEGATSKKEGEGGVGFLPKREKGVFSIPFWEKVFPLLLK